MNTCYLPFCLVIALAISGRGKGDTGPKAITNEAEAVVKLLKQKLAAANGLIAPRQLTYEDHSDEKYKKLHAEWEKATEAWRKGGFNGDSPEMPEPPKVNQMESIFLVWEDDKDLAIDVKKSDSVVSPYTGTAEISFYEEMAVSDLRRRPYYQGLNLQDGKQVTLASIVELAVRNGMTDPRTDKPMSKEDWLNNIREARERDKGKKTLRFYYQYTDSKWKLIKCERTDRDGKIEELKLADFPQFQ